MLPRLIQPVLEELFERYPVVTMTGPRQAGKTTLCRAVFSGLPYVNLERPDVRLLAQEDPLGFLGRYPDGAVIDEVQRVPELLSYIQVRVDEVRRPGQFVLTGSQNFSLSQGISQSLAGRTALLRLLPLSVEETGTAGLDLSVDEMLFRGFYPRLYEMQLNPTQMLGDYFETYVERDVRQLSELRDLVTFQRFVRLLAGRTGQLVNYSSLGGDVGVSHTTIREWLSLLEASYVIFRLPPYFANISKRLVKSPKIYFVDVGLAAYLLGIESAAQIFTHPLRGALFENLVVAEALKARTHRGQRGDNLFFYRDSSGLEVDLLLAVADRLIGVEMKSGATFSKSFLKGLRQLSGVLGDRLARRVVVHDADSTFPVGDVTVTRPRDVAGVLRRLSGELAGDYSGQITK
ncbi:MAG: ATP-binding protein [Acidobacteriota bacterium]